MNWQAVSVRTHSPLKELRCDRQIRRRRLQPARAATAAFRPPRRLKPAPTGCGQLLTVIGLAAGQLEILLEKEGWLRGQLKSATLFSADGVVSSAPIHSFAGLTTPAA